MRGAGRFASGRRARPPRSEEADAASGGWLPAGPGSFVIGVGSVVLAAGSARPGVGGSSDGGASPRPPSTSVIRMTR